MRYKVHIKINLEANNFVPTHMSNKKISYDVDLILFSSMDLFYRYKITRTQDLHK